MTPPSWPPTLNSSLLILHPRPSIVHYASFKFHPYSRGWSLTCLLMCGIKSLFYPSHETSPKHLQTPISLDHNTNKPNDFSLSAPLLKKNCWRFYFIFILSPKEFQFNVHLLGGCSCLFYPKIKKQTGMSIQDENTLTKHWLS